MHLLVLGLWFVSKTTHIIAQVAIYLPQTVRDGVLSFSPAFCTLGRRPHSRSHIIRKYAEPLIRAHNDLCFKSSFQNSVQFVSFEVMSVLFTSGPAAAPQHLARPRVESAFPPLRLCLHGNHFASLAHLSVRRNDTLVGVFSSALHGSELVSACASFLCWLMSQGSSISFASFTIADIVSSATSLSWPTFFLCLFLHCLALLARALLRNH